MYEEAGHSCKIKRDGLVFDEGTVVGRRIVRNLEMISRFHMQTRLYLRINDIRL